MRTILLFTTILILSGCAYYKPKYSGRVSEINSNKPIAKAEIAVTYWAGYFYGYQGDRSLDTIKVKTDKDGYFVVPAFFSLIPPLTWDEGVRFRIDKWGYTTVLSTDISKCLSVGCDPIEFSYAFDPTKKIIIGSHSVQLDKMPVLSTKSAIYLRQKFLSSPENNPVDETSVRTVRVSSDDINVSVQSSPLDRGIVFDRDYDRTTNGNTVNSLEFLVSGTVSVANPAKIVVSVNGAAAQVNGGRFAADVQLQKGNNTITVVATGGGDVHQATTQVFSLPTTDYVSLTADVSTGIVPLNVEMTARVEISESVSSYYLECTGPTAFIPVTSGRNTFRATFNLPGLYICRLVALDQDGTIFDDSVIINAYQSQHLGP